MALGWGCRVVDRAMRRPVMGPGVGGDRDALAQLLEGMGVEAGAGGQRAGCRGGGRLGAVEDEGAGVEDEGVGVEDQWAAAGEPGEVGRGVVELLRVRLLRLMGSAASRVGTGSSGGGGGGASRRGASGSGAAAGGAAAAGTGLRAGEEELLEACVSGLTRILLHQEWWVSIKGAGAALEEAEQLAVLTSLLLLMFHPAGSEGNPEVGRGG